MTMASSLYSRHGLAAHMTFSHRTWRGVKGGGGSLLKTSAYHSGEMLESLKSRLACQLLYKTLCLDIGIE